DFAATWEEQATLRAVGGATCNLLDVVKDLGDAATVQDVDQVIRFHVRKQGLVETDAKVIDVAKGIIEQLDSLDKTGQLDDTGILLTLGCLPF
ncbi:MAG: hypothetical protein QOF11_2432, partial [Chloroflexota bacterium]|nr:hypothetical protein [Chloroflexota bacterium]